MIQRRTYLESWQTSWCHKSHWYSLRIDPVLIDIPYGLGFRGIIENMGPGDPSDLGKMSTNNSSRPCSINGCNGLNSGRVSTCSGQRRSLCRMYKASRSSSSPTWILSDFSCSRRQRHVNLLSRSLHRKETNRSHPNETLNLRFSSNARRLIRERVNCFVYKHRRESCEVEHCLAIGWDQF